MFISLFKSKCKHIEIYIEYTKKFENRDIKLFFISPSPNCEMKWVNVICLNSIS